MKEIPQEQQETRKLRLLILLTLVMGLFSGVVLGQLFPNIIGPLDASSDFRLISEAWRIIRSVYVDRAAAQPRVMAYGAISGMVDALGDTGHSRFLSREMVKKLDDLQRNKFEGVGAEIQIRTGHVVIVAPMDDSPAQRAGLHAGDIILKVNEREITGLPLDQVVALVSGPAGTSVNLTILDSASGHARDVNLVRASIAVHNVTWQNIPDTKLAHLRITSFNTGATEELRAALQKINGDGRNGIILDLRNNPGGLLSEAIGAASQFLKNGNVLLVKNASGVIRPIPVKPGGIAYNMPLVVLINGGTASAAEILAGALNSAHRAKLVGEPTIGTGTVLNEFRLFDGSALLLAIEEWLTPSGQLIWHKGISPDTVVKLSSDASLLLPEAERNLTLAEIRAKKDEQLIYALDLLGKPKIAGGPGFIVKGDSPHRPFHVQQKSSAARIVPASCRQG
jgi:carboxyl-terminal processing protease